MRAPLLLPLTLLLTACDFAESLTRASAPAHAYAQAVAIDTVGVVARRVSATLPATTLSLDDISMLPDGRSGILVDWESGDLARHDFTTGATTRLTHNSKPYDPGFANEVRVSPDGRRVAYSWFVDSLGVNRIELRLLDLAGGPPRVIYEGQDKGWADPRGWSPDGTTLAAAIQSPEGDWRIATLSTKGGDPRAVRSTDQRTPGVVEFSPDGRFLAYDHSSDPAGDAGDIYVVELSNGREREVAASPADDRLVGWLPGSDQIVFASDRTGTTGLWSLGVENGRANGNPVLVHPDFWQSGPRGFTADGLLYFTVQVSSARTMAADFDLATGALRNVEPLFLGPEDRSSWRYHFPAWSLDGRAIALITRPVAARRFVVTVRSNTTDETREYPMPSQVKRIGAPRWSGDESTILMAADTIESQSGPMRWNAIVRVDLASGRSEILDVDAEFDALGALSDARSVVLRRIDGARVVTLAVRDLTDGTERPFFQMAGDAAWARAADGMSVVFHHLAAVDPFDVYMVPLDGSSAPHPVPGVSVPASAQFKLDTTGRVLLTTYRDASRPATITVERVPLDGSARTRATMVLPPEYPYNGRGTPVISPTGDRILYSSGVQAHELWVLEGLGTAGATTASVR